MTSHAFDLAGLSGEATHSAPRGMLKTFSSSIRACSACARRGANLSMMGGSFLAKSDQKARQPLGSFIPKNELQFPSGGTAARNRISSLARQGHVDTPRVLVLEDILEVGEAASQS